MMVVEDEEIVDWLDDLAVMVSMMNSVKYTHLHMQHNNKQTYNATWNIQQTTSDTTHYNNNSNTTA